MRRISAILLIGATMLAVHASASDGILLSPSDMTSALERKIVSGVGVMYPGSDLESATTPALALLDAEWPDPFLDRIGETISVRVSSTTGYYEFTDESGSVFWIAIPVAPLTWNWVAPFLRPYDPPTQDFSLIAPWHLADRWRLSTEALEELRAVPPLLRSLPPRSAPETSDVTNLCFTAFAFTETNLYFTAAWPTNDALPENLLDLYCSTNELNRFRFLLSSHPATNPPVSFDIPSALVPNWGCATSHVHDATCPVVTNIVLSPLDGTTIYTNVVYGCAVTNSPQEAAFFRLGSRVDTDGDGLADAYERYVTLTDENRADSDGDGFSDGAEWAAGTNPFDPDTDGDGVPDGQTGVQWLSHPLWARNGDCTNLVIFLYEPVTNGVAVLRFDDLAIPLSTDAGPWCLCIPTNAVVTCRLVSSPGAVVMLWYGPPEAAVPTRSLVPGWSVPSSVAVPIWCDNPMAVFGGNNWGGGVCRFARPTLRVRSAEPGNSEDDLDVCVHSSDLRARFAWSVEPNVCTGLCAYGTGGLSFPGSQGEFFLDVGQAALGESGTQTGTLFVESEQSPFFGCNVLFGTLVETVTAHPCMGWIDDGFGFCLSCGVAHGPPRGASSCLHESLCASKTNLLADCDCSQPFVRIGSTGVYKLVGDLISCCHAHSYASYGAQLLSVPGALHASVGNGSYLAVEPDARSPIIGGFVANYRILDGDGAFYRDLSLSFTCADLGIDPCLSNVQVPYGEDPEAYFVTNGVFYVARRSSPYPLRLWNESPSDALLVLAFAAPTNGPVLRANTTGNPSLVGALSVTNATPFAALNDDATVYLDASCSNSLATLSLELSDPATDRTFLSESLSVQVVDTTIGEHWRVRSATDRIAWDFSDAPEPVWICLRHPAQNGEYLGQMAGSPVVSKTPSFSLDLPPNDYLIEAYFPRIYDGHSYVICETNTLHVRQVPEFARDVVGVQCRTDQRVEVALTNDTFHSDIQWTLSPIVTNGPRLFATSNTVSGATSMTSCSNVWVSAGTVPGVYSVTASYPGFTNATAYVIDPVVDINGDFFRSGTPEDDPCEADPVCFTNDFGFVIPCNNNDSDGDDIADCRDTVINGASDATDLREIVICGMGLDGISNELLGRLRVFIIPFGGQDDVFPELAPWEVIHLFASDDSGTPQFEDDEDGTGYSIRPFPVDAETEVRLFLEGLVHGATTGIRLRVFFDEECIGEDLVRLRVAPFIVNANTDQTRRVFLSESFPSFDSAIFQILSGSVGCVVHSAGFIQDYAEIGSSLFPVENGLCEQSTVWGLFGDQFETLVTNDVGHFSGFARGGLGGDVEALPPCRRFPYGKVVIGSKNAESVPNISRFFAGQSLQVDSEGPMVLPTDWLRVGHVDEIFAVVPRGTNFIVAVADLNLAIDCLRVAVDSGDPVVVQKYSQMLANFENPDNSNRVAFIQEQLDCSVEMISSDLEDGTNSIVRLPVLFSLPVANGTNYIPVVSAIPNSVNMMVVSSSIGNAEIILPDPELESFRNCITNQLFSSGVQPTSIHFVDTSEMISGTGYAHCASNVLRRRTDDE